MFDFHFYLIERSITTYRSPLPMRKLLIIFILFFFIILLDIGLWLFDKGGGFIILLISAYSMIGIVLTIFLLLRKWLGYTLVDYFMLIIVFLPAFWMIWKIVYPSLLAQ